MTPEYHELKDGEQAKEAGSKNCPKLDRIRQ